MPTVDLTPYSTRQAELERRRRIAEALQAQSMSPIDMPSVPGANVSPVQGLAKLAEGLIASLSQRKLRKQQESMDTEQNAAIQQQMAQLLGTNQTQMPPDLQRLGAEFGANTNVQAPTDLAPGFGSEFPKVQQLAAALMGQRAQQGTQQQQQQFTAGQNALNRGTTERGQDIQAQNYAAEAAARLAEANRPRPIPQGAALPLPGGGYTIPAPAPAPQRNIDPNSPEGIAARIKFETLKPKDTTGADLARSDKSYQFNSGQLEAVAKPLADRVQRLSNLSDTIYQATPQADALIAPELLTAMAGGQGSGLRMNEAEISRIVGGRSHWESLKAAVNKWQADPSKALSITTDQRQQIRSLMQTVQQKLTQKVNAINDARQALVDTQDPIKQRQIVVDANKKLNDIDSGAPSEGNAPQGGLIIPGGALDKLLKGAR